MAPSSTPSSPSPSVAFSSSSRSLRLVTNSTLTSSSERYPLLNSSVLLLTLFPGSLLHCFSVSSPLRSLILASSVTRRSVLRPSCSSYPYVLIAPYYTLESSLVFRVSSSSVVAWSWHLATLSQEPFASASRSFIPCSSGLVCRLVLQPIRKSRITRWPGQMT